MAGEVRQPIDQKSLERYLDQHVPEIKTPIELKQFGFGQSNPTYLLTSSTKKKFVLRKKPPGKLLSRTAHRVDREFQVLHALQDTNVPVPKTYAMCEDENVIGTIFYIMECLEGRFIENAAMPDVPEKERKEMWRDAVRTLAKLHRIDVKSVGLEKLGRPNGFYKRQLKTFGGLGRDQGQAGKAVGALPHFDDFLSFFGEEETQPVDRGVLFHGDFKIDNLVFHATEPRVIGILDWEMVTIGHPLADLTNLTQGYTASTSTPSWPRKHADKAFLTPEKHGLPTLQECISWYESDVGWKVGEKDLAWATAFALFRDSIIFQGIAARYATRQASSASAREYAEERGPFAEMAWEKVRVAKRKGGGKL